MSLQDVIAYLMGAHPIAFYIVSGLGGLIVVAEVVVILTPSKDDDLVWGRIKSIPILGSVISALAELAPIKKKEKLLK